MQAYNIIITTSSQQSSQSINRNRLRGPEDLDLQVLSWILEYRKRDCYRIEDILLQSPQFALGELAQFSLRKKKTKSMLNLGNIGALDDSFSLRSLVTFLNDNITAEATSSIKGVRIRLVQLLSSQQKIV